MTDNAIEAVYHESSPEPLSVVQNAINHARDFDRIKASLLDRSRHINNIQGKDRVNKAGWQIIGAALGVRTEIISKNANGNPGAYREILEDAKGKKIVSFSITVRATSGDRMQDRTGRCDSSETKHNQYEHKMESVAHTRAFNAAVCAIVGGEPGDNADEAEDDQYFAQEQQPQERKQVAVPILLDLHKQKGSPNGTLGKWLVDNIRYYKAGTKLTPSQSLLAYELLEAL